jgi:hypothetical protein
MQNADIDLLGQEDAFLADRFGILNAEFGI